MANENEVEAHISFAEYTNIDAKDIRKALNSEPSKYVYAANRAGHIMRIIAARQHHGFAEGKSLATGKWFVITNWYQE